jgi:hypothetical protein
MVRSSASAFGGIAAVFEGAIPEATPASDDAKDLLAEETEVAAGVAAAGAVMAVLLAGGKFTGGFGAKNLAHSKITAIERIEAIRMRISEESSFFFCGSLKDVPLCQ